jgi:TonB-dependent starch-binding outer membrane protein SusC
MLMKRILISLAGILLPLAMFAQIKISGTVKDVDGNALSGASIIQKGTAKATVADQNGKFNLEIANENSTLQVSFLGYEKQEVRVGSVRTFSFILKESTSTMDEVVVVGYGTLRKSDVTGALANVTSEQLMTRPVNNAFEALQGKVAGVDITSNERPGEIGSIHIRGQRSLTDKINEHLNDPLYVVDGVPLSSGGIETLNPRDIESMDILKDASATAIYGSRGANGVILVTTKSGKSGTFSLNYSGAMTVENIQDKAPAMSASDYITWRRWAYYDPEGTTYPRGDEPTMANDQTIFSNSLDDDMTLANVLSGWSNGTWDGSKVINTDWTDYVKQTGISQEHTISASGGNDFVKSYISFGYLNNEGTEIGQNYERYNTKLSVDVKPKPWFNMGGSIAATWSQQDYGFSRTGQSSSSGPTSIYQAAKQILNIAQPYNSEGEIINYPGGQSGVYTIIGEVGKSKDSRQTLRALGSFYAGVNFGKIIPLLDGLKYRVNLGPEYKNYRNGIYIDESSAVRLGGTNYAKLNLEREFSWTLDNIVTYDKTFGIHKVGVTVLQSASVYNSETASMSGENVPKDSYLWNNMGSIDILDSDTKASMGSGLTDTQLASYMGRLNYSLNEKYLLTVSGRYDGSSVLAKGHKWAFFPSAALGWRIDQEEFMQNQSVLDQLKLRLGVGTTGNAAVTPYSTVGAIQSFYVPFGGSTNALAYATNEPYYTSTQVSMANPLLKWETTTQYNLGVDFSVLKNRIAGTIELYQSHTSDLLMDMTISTLTGFKTTKANVGETKNRGIELSLNINPIRLKDFRWDMNINAAYQEDEIVALAYGKQDMIDNSWLIGESISIFYGLKADGLWQESDAEEMALFNANGHTFEAGMVKPVDKDGNHVINSADRDVLGNQLPKWTLGLNNTFTYQNFELSCTIYGRFGYMISTGGEGQLGMYQQRQIDYWTPNNTDAEWQKPIYSQSGGDPYSALLGFRNASFLKLRNISLGYFVPKETCKHLGIQNLKMYVQVKNPGTLYSTVDWIDLDLGGSTFNRGLVFGLEIGF